MVRSSVEGSFTICSIASAHVVRLYRRLVEYGLRTIQIAKTVVYFSFFHSILDALHFALNALYPAGDTAHFVTGAVCLIKGLCNCCESFFFRQVIQPTQRIVDLRISQKLIQDCVLARISQQWYFNTEDNLTCVSPRYHLRRNGKDRKYFSHDIDNYFLQFWRRCDLCI
jgi:hypothetical protein